MGVNIIVCLLAAGFLLDLRSGVPSQEHLGPEQEAPANDDAVGQDAYMVAVLISAGAAILSLCL